MGKIATELEAYNIGGITLVDIDSNKCCTYSRAKKIGCHASGYEDDQLVQLEDLVAYVTVSFPTNLDNLKIAQAYNGITPTAQNHICYGVRYSNTNYWVGFAPINASSDVEDRTWYIESSYNTSIPKDYLNDYTWIIGVTASSSSLSSVVGVSLQYRYTSSVNYLNASVVSSNTTIYIYSITTVSPLNN